MIKLKNILKEDEISDKFGDIAFGDDDEIAALQGKSGGEEYDTDFENHLINLLQRWVKDSTHNLDIQDELDKIKNILKKAKGKFPTVFKPKTPNGTKLYRGIQWKNKNIKSLFTNNSIPKSGLKPHKISTDLGIEKFWKYETPINYKPQGKIQSWSTKSSIAVEFSQGLLLETKQNDEYIFNQKLFSILWDRVLSNEPSEEEVLHFGKTYSEPVYLLISDGLYKKYLSGDVEDWY